MCTKDLTPLVQTDKQSRAGPGAEAMPADPVPESPGARRPVEESTAAADVLGGGERLAPSADGSAVMPREMAEAVGSSEADAGVADATLESSVGKPVGPEEQAALPETSKGVVGRTVRPPSPQVVPLAMEEEDKVEEIEHEES